MSSPAGSLFSVLEATAAAPGQRAASGRQATANGKGTIMERSITRGAFGAAVLSSFAIVLGLAPAGALASSHREAPAISRDQVADNTDLYAWVSPGRDRLYVIANWIPLEEPSNGPNYYRFSDDVRYEIHVTRGASLDDAMVYRVEFKTPEVPRVDPADLAAPPGGGKEFFIQLTGALAQTYTVTKVMADGSEQVVAQDVPVAPPNIGPRTQQTANQLGLAPFTSATYDEAFTKSFIRDMGTEGRVWAGQRDDPFYVDIGAIADLANLRPDDAVDGLAGFNVHSIALEIPVERLTADGQRPGNAPGVESTLGLWASSSRQELTTLRSDGAPERSGRWIQVSRLGLPLVNEALIGYQDKDKYNRTRPKDDVANFGAYFLNPVLVRDAEAVGIYQALGVDPAPFKSNRTDIIETISLKNIPTEGAHPFPPEAIGDVLRVDLATESAFPNGRPLVPGDSREQADVTDVILSLVLAKGALPIADGVSANECTFLTEFPFLAQPHESFESSHGRRTAELRAKQQRAVRR